MRIDWATKQAMPTCGETNMHIEIIEYSWKVYETVENWEGGAWHESSTCYQCRVHPCVDVFYERW